MIFYLQYIQRRFHGNLMGTPREYNLGSIVLLSTNSKLSNFVQCTMSQIIASPELYLF